MSTPRGFAALTPERRREIVAKGGRAVPAAKRSFSWGWEEGLSFEIVQAQSLPHPGPHRRSQGRLGPSQGSPPMTDLTPLLTVTPDAIPAIFLANPLTLSDPTLTTLITELRRRRSLSLADDAAKAAKGKSARTKPGPVSPATAALLDKPPSELSLDDLEA